MLEEDLFKKEVPPDLEETLREFYPSASDAEITHYIECIKTYQSEKLPPTKAAKEYWQIDRDIKELTAEKDRLKEILVSQFKRLGNHQFELVGVRKNKPEKIVYNPERAYEWIISQVDDPEIVERLTVRILNGQEFERLEAEGIIKITESPPEDIINRVEAKESYTLTPEGARKGGRKKKE